MNTSGHSKFVFPIPKIKWCAAKKPDLLPEIDCCWHCNKYIEHNTLNKLDVNTHNYLKMEVEHNTEYTRGTILNFIFGSTYRIFSSVCNGFGLSFILLVCATKALHGRVQHTYMSHYVRLMTLAFMKQVK
jgi:hypothetical protein